jgi:two-component system sensor histidine kinase CpxA
MRYLQTRILIWYLATLVVSLIAFVSISVTIGTRDTRKNVGHLLEMQVEGSIRAYEEGGPEALSKYLQQMDSWFTSTHYLVDAQNRDLVSGQVNPASLNLAPQSGQVPTILRRLFRTRTSFAVSSPDGQYRLLYIASQPWDNVPAQLPYYLLVLIGTAVVYWFVPMGIASSLKTIATTAERFGGGDLGARVQLPDRKDEIGDLARTFNAMASHIQTLLVAERRLLQDVSHELRSPLARLAFAAELARTAPDRDAAINRLKRELDCLSGLVASLLDVTRAEGDPLADRLELVRLEDVLQNVVESCTLDAEARECRLTVSGSSAGVIRANRELLRQGLDNVVRNALQYSPAGSEIEITREDVRDETVVCIRDHGPGVPKHLLTQIFEPFFRVDGARRASTGGVGLGLSIVRRIVDLHNGRVSAENVEPGLRVTIVLPHGVAAPGERPRPAEVQADDRTAWRRRAG